LNSEGFKTRKEGMIRVIQVRNILKHLDSWIKKQTIVCFNSQSEFFFRLKS
jgi:hypothetical protein